MATKREVEKALASYKMTIANGSPLQKPLLYALETPGMRFRPQIVMKVARALNPSIDVSCGAVAIELFHLASLLADDLPCMDDARERRGQKALHLVFGEATAILVTYVLIGEGYRLLATSSSPHVALLVEQTSLLTGLQGACSGQHLDLKQQVDAGMLQQKTATLFALSFLYGWVLGGGDLELRECAQTAGLHFGLAFQLFDDLEDQNSFALKFGNKATIDLATRELSLFKESLQKLSLPQNLFQSFEEGLFAKTNVSFVG